MRLKLTGPQRGQIRNIIVDAYVGPTPLVLLAKTLSDHLDRDIYQIVPTNLAFPDQVAQLLTQANGEGWLASLLNAIKQDRTECEDLQELLRYFLNAIPVQQLLDTSVGAATLLKSDHSELHRILLGGAIVKLETMQRRIRTVCRVDYVDQNPPGEATGFLVGPDLVLTNWHVLKRVIEEPMTVKHLRFRFDLLDSTAAADGIGRVAVAAGGGIALLRSKPAGGVELYKGLGEPSMKQLDYALIRLQERVGDDPIPDSAVGERRGNIILRRVMPLPTAGGGIMVLQHPLRGELQFAIGVVLGMNETGSRIKHTAATQSGSSGSLVLDTALGPVALHNGTRSGTLRTGQAFNTAVPLRLVVEDLTAAGITEMLAE